MRKHTNDLSTATIARESIIDGRTIHQPTLQAPQVNLNGTSADVLIDQYRDALDALDKALHALALMTPHGRDYQTLGADALRTATQQHLERCAAVREVEAELALLAGHVQEQADQRADRKGSTGARAVAVATYFEHACSNTVVTDEGEIEVSPADYGRLRYCVKHHRQLSSPDGMFDAPCGECEAERERNDEARRVSSEIETREARAHDCSGDPDGCPFCVDHTMHPRYL